MYLTVDSEEDIPKGFRSVDQLWADGYRVPKDGKPWTFEKESSEFDLRLTKFAHHTARDFMHAASDAILLRNGKGSFVRPSEAEAMVKENIACDRESDGMLFIGPDALRCLEDSGAIVKQWAEREISDAPRTKGGNLR